MAEICPLIFFFSQNHCGDTSKDNNCITCAGKEGSKPTLIKVGFCSLSGSFRGRVDHESIIFMCSSVIPVSGRYDRDRIIIPFLFIGGYPLGFH